VESATTITATPQTIIKTRQKAFQKKANIIQDRIYIRFYVFYEKILLKCIFEIF
jgi:hypothetical protein